MAYKEKFYYIDENGNKKKYVGKVIYNNDGTYNGILNKNTKTVCTKDLIYHPEVKAIDGYYSYYSYITNNGKEQRVFDNIRKDENNNPYFTYVERNMFNLTYVEPVPFVAEHFTYIDPVTKEEHPYEDNVIYNKRLNKYFGVVVK